MWTKEAEREKDTAIQRMRRTTLLNLFKIEGEMKKVSLQFLLAAPPDVFQKRN